MSTNIVDFPARSDDDDVIEERTGISLIDADAAVIARRWAEKSWEDRTRFFSNIICESTKCWVVAVQGLEDDQETRDIFTEWVLLGMCERIAEIINLWSGIGPNDGPRETEAELRPSCELAAAIFNLSLSPRHRRAARLWAVSESKKPNWYYTAVSEYEPLIVFANMIWMSRPGMGYFDRFGVPDDPDAMDARAR